MTNRCATYRRYYKNKKQLFDFYAEYKRKPYYRDDSFKGESVLSDWLLNMINNKKSIFVKDFFKELKDDFKNKFGITFDDMWKSGHEKYISKQVVLEENSVVTLSATKKKRGRPKKKLIADDMQSVEAETTPLPEEKATEKSNKVDLEAKQYRELKARQKEYSDNYRRTAKGKERRRLAHQKWKKKKADEAEHRDEENCNKHIHCEEGNNLTIEKINNITTVDVGIQTDNNDVCVKPKPKHKHDFQFSNETGYAVCRECSHFIKLN